MRVELAKSNRKGKKYMAKVQGKTVHFGATGYQDFTQHQDSKRKERYIKRHRANENWNDTSSAGFWARHLLWSEPSLAQAIRKTEQKFKLDIVK